MKSEYGEQNRDKDHCVCSLLVFSEIIMHFEIGIANVVCCRRCCAI